MTKKKRAAKPTSPSPRSGWSLARPRSLPGPTFWPAGLALGITIMAWSIVTSAIVGLIGGLFFAVSLGNWIAEALRDEQDE